MGRHKKYPEKTEGLYLCNIPLTMIKQIKELSKRHNISKRDLVVNALNKYMDGGIPKILQGDWRRVRDFLTNKRLVDKGGFWRPVQVYGLTGNGKSVTMQKTIKRMMNEYDFAVIDPKNEYKDLRIGRIGDKGTFRIVLDYSGIQMMDEHIIFQHYRDLSKSYGQKENPNRIVVIDEAHIFGNAEFILRKVRSDFRGVFITSKNFAENFPTIEIVESQGNIK